MAGIQCPKCSQAMRTWTTGGVTLDHCVGCRGLWFDESELSRHFANMGTRIQESEAEPRRETSLSCPRCGKDLVEASLDGVTLESCAGCRGIFLDLGEVHELLGAANRPAYERDPATAGFDDFALGLYIGARLGSTG